MKLQQSLTRWAVSLSAAHLACCGLAQAQSLDPGTDLGDDAYPIVITPTRLRQSLADVPASITILTGETLRRHGITRIEEALRMVPGMAVSQATGNDYRINYHGTAAVAPRRLNVLIDGVSAYLPAFSQVEWTLLPVTLEDIDRIEVIRGPDSAAYGPNSMMAVVNILTKHPKDVERGLVAFTAGSHETYDGTVRLATTVGSTSVRATANVQHNRGYDQMSTLGGAHDSTHLSRLSVRALHELSVGSTLDMQASYVGGEGERGYIEPFQVSSPDHLLNSTQFSTRWTKSLAPNHEVQVDFSRAETRSKQQWRSCWPQAAFWPEVANLFQANPDYVTQMVQGNLFPTGGSAGDNVLAGLVRGRLIAEFPSGLQNTCGMTNQDGVESRTQIELQDTYVVSDTLRVVAGLGLRRQEASSQTFFGGRVHNSVQWVFGHAEYRPFDWVTANLGGYGESNSLSGSTFSPRMALNLRVAQNQTVRAVVSKGTRTPDLFEERAHWSYTITGLSTPVNGSSTGRMFAVGLAKSDLSSEQIWSRELGYLLILRSLGLTVDARVFDDRLSRLISTATTITNFAPSNSGSVRLTGAELQTSWDISPRWSTWLSYGYLLNRDARHIEETAQYSRHSGAAGVSVALSAAWRASLAHYASSGNGVHEVRYARTDLTVGHSFLLGRQPASASLTIGYLDTPTVHTFQDATRYFTSAYDRRFSVHGQFRAAF